MRVIVVLYLLFLPFFLYAQNSLSLASDVYQSGDYQKAKKYLKKSSP